MILQKSQFNDLQAFKEHLTITASQSILCCLIDCHQKNPERYTGRQSDVYDYHAKEAIRYAKAWVNQLKLK